jgi:carbon monoxide dehydrogenase subunit G
MALQFQSTLEIAAPPERVFEALTDHGVIRQWMPNLVKFESLTPQTSGVGSQWRETRKMFGHEAAEVFEVTGFERPRQISLFCDGRKGTSGKGEYRFDYRLEPNGSGTRVTIDSAIDMPGGWLTKLMGRLMSGMFKKMCMKDMMAMKAFVERQA